MTTKYSPASQQGITLIESLVAIVVMALGILGILGVQMRTLTDTQTSVRRAQAIRLIEDLSERMKVNPNALISLKSYTIDFTDDPASEDCSTQACTQTGLIAHDLHSWTQNVQNMLPLGQASIFLPPAESTDTTRRQLGVMLAWRENEREITNAADQKSYKENIDATQVRATDGSLSAGGGTLLCPSGFTCHLQYISVAARCAPYLGGGSTQFYCPGA